MAIEECQNLETMKLEELIGSIQMFELKFKALRKKKSIALKVENQFSSDNDSYVDVAMVDKNFKKILMLANFMKKQFSRRPQLNFRRNEMSKEEPTCYECKGKNELCC